MDEEQKPELLGQFPSNSKRDRQTQDPLTDKKIEKVICGDVVRKKKSFVKKITEIFLEDDTRSVGDYVFHDVLIPAAKGMISDMIGGGLEMLLFGGRRGSRTTRDRGRSYMNYSNASYRGATRESSLHRETRDTGRNISSVGRARFDFDEIVLDTRGEAEEVLSHLADLVIDYSEASVADLYDLVGITSSYTDNKWGWRDLRGANVNRVRGGYMLNLPRPQPID